MFKGFAKDMNEYISNGLIDAVFVCDSEGKSWKESLSLILKDWTKEEINSI